MSIVNPEIKLVNWNKAVKYMVLAGSCLTQFTVIGILFSYGVLMNEFEIYFGWPRAILSAANSAAFICMGILVLVVGHLSDRFSPRLILSVTGLLFGFGVSLTALITEPFHLILIFCIFVGIGMSTHDVVTLSSVAKSFEKRLGIMTGITKVGTAMGQVCIPPFLAVLIFFFEWKQAIIILGLLGGILLLTAAYLMKVPEKKLTSTEEESSGISDKQARRTFTFWKLGAIQFLFLSALMTIPVHIAIHGIDLGMTPQKASFLLSAIGFSSIAGRLIVGISVDNFGAKSTYLICFIPLIISLFMFREVSSHNFLFLTTLLYGFSHGSFFTVVSPAVKEYFGMKSHGAIFGSILFLGTLGGSICPIIAGRIFDITGSYNSAFLGLGMCGLLGLGIVLLLPSYRKNP
ncbi:MAG: MFS transporter [Paracoccaceae bacterium]|tara:strand:+ start:692 stop:1903 length:1212 start_codon:yes stop_codon:yes gene_type:complete